MKKKFSFIVLALLLAIVLATCLVACDNTTTPDNSDNGDGNTNDTGNNGGQTLQFTVVLNLQNGKDPITLKVDKGSAANFEEPTRECYVFDGWFTNKACTTAYDTTAPINQSLILYAGWKLEPNHVHSYTTSTVAPTCTAKGYDEHVCKCGDTVKDTETEATGHNFTTMEESDDYFTMFYCDNDGCTLSKRKESLHIYDDTFIPDFDENRKAEIDGRYQSMLDILNNIEKYDKTIHGYEKDSDLYVENKAFEEIYNAFYDDLMYLVEQYQYAYVRYCVKADESNTEVYETITEYRTNAISNFYALYRLIYETKFREYFFAEDEGWTEEDIQMALTMSDSYGGEKYAEINTRISEIEVEFRAMKDPTNDIVEEGEKTMPELYEEFVNLNNQLAQLAGYNNYIEYAYKNVYNREYTPEDTAQMRSLVKQYMSGVYKEIYDGYYRVAYEYDSLEKNSIESTYFKAIMDQSVFKTKLTSDLVGDYFKLMTSTDGAQAIDFHSHASDLFKNGNYFTGSYKGAYSYWIGTQDTSILYFGPGSYSSAFTFVHEFGHYYNNIYNPGVSFSYDLDETHSQGNEMLFLSFLEDALPTEILRGVYERVYYEQLFNMVAITLLATAIDEFEYCVYTGHSPSGAEKTYTASDYEQLFSSILASYGAKGLNTSYWRYVVIESPCYYISYAMSALPCIELLSIAETEGFDVAKAKYLGFFTFTDDPNNVEIDEFGDKVVKIGYTETLEYVGLSSIFEKEMYIYINNYFCNNKKDFTYPDAE